VNDLARAAIIACDPGVAGRGFSTDALQVLTTDMIRDSLES
jgi:hypothetical protein